VAVGVAVEVAVGAEPVVVAVDVAVAVAVAVAVSVAVAVEVAVGADPVKVAVDVTTTALTDETGPVSLGGTANVTISNIARMNVKPTRRCIQQLFMSGFSFNSDF